MHDDRRKVVRLLPPDTVIAGCSSPFLALGRIHDISSQGLSVEYEDGAGRPVLDRPIHITLAGGRNPMVTVDDLCCQPVYDIAVLTHGRGFRGRRMRQSGMVYCPGQVNQIRNLSQLFDRLA